MPLLTFAETSDPRGFAPNLARFEVLHCDLGITFKYTRTNEDAAGINLHRPSEIAVLDGRFFMNDQPPVPKKLPR
jgi:hypothetical protein